MRQILPAPATPRDMLRLFAFYEPEKGLQPLLNRLDLATMTARQVGTVVPGPADAAPAAGDGEEDAEEADFNPRSALHQRLSGAEFQTCVREIVLNAFPEKRRTIFIHIPKCAGTDLIAGLRRSMPMLHLTLATPNITQKPDLFAAIREIVLGMAYADTIGISGHVPLRWYLERDLVRPDDDLFTVVREPRSMIYSYISFMLTRMKTFAGVRRNDTTNWLKGIGMTEIEPSPSDAYLLDIGSRLLRAPTVTSRNIICNNLGRGNAASALDNIVATNIEITETRRYSTWKERRFGLRSAKRLNESLPLYTPELAPADDRDFIEAMVQEDVHIYDRIMAAFESSEEISIRGQALA